MGGPDEDTRLHGRKTRKAHNKSRNGCTNCKSRHVKCDEQGPPCAACISRKTASSCRFKKSNRKHSPPTTLSSSDALIVTPPPLLGAAPEISTLLQLELMHRWSTDTYKSFIAVPPDVEFMQVSLPQQSFKHPFLLNGLLAITALNVASKGRPEYLRKAMEFYDQSSAEFRSNLSCVTKDNIESVYIFSSIVLGINAALLPQLQRTAIETTVTCFDLMIGTAILAHKNKTLLLQSDYGASVVYAEREFNQESVPLNDEVELALVRLFTLIDRYTELDPEFSAPKPMVLWKSSEAMYRNAVLQLRRCYLQDAKKNTGFCVALPTMTGHDFVDACRVREPLALIILMHWGLLMDRLSYQQWWADRVGKGVVIEAADILARSETRMAEIPEYHESIAWANDQLEIQTLVTGQAFKNHLPFSYADRSSNDIIMAFERDSSGSNFTAGDTAS